MLLHVMAVLTAQELQTVRGHLSSAAWTDGRLTAGYQSAQVKANLQVPQADPAAREASSLIVKALERNATFVSATLPHHVYPPLFNRYTPGMGFGEHIDNAVRQIPGTAHRLRTDVAATLFLAAPEEYDGGELVIDDLYGTHSVKLAAGDMVVYPSSSVHRVQPVTPVRAMRLFSGSRAWCATAVRAPCSTSWTCPFATSPPMAPMPAACCA